MLHCTAPCMLLCGIHLRYTLDESVVTNSLTSPQSDSKPSATGSVVAATVLRYVRAPVRVSREDEEKHGLDSSQDGADAVRYVDKVILDSLQSTENMEKRYLALGNIL